MKPANKILMNVVPHQLMSTTTNRSCGKTSATTTIATTATTTTISPSTSSSFSSPTTTATTSLSSSTTTASKSSYRLSGQHRHEMKQLLQRLEGDIEKADASSRSSSTGDSGNNVLSPFDTSTPGSSGSSSSSSSSLRRRGSVRYNDDDDKQPDEEDAEEEEAPAQYEDKAMNNKDRPRRESHMSIASSGSRYFRGGREFYDDQYYATVTRSSRLSGTSLNLGPAIGESMDLEGEKSDQDDDDTASEATIEDRLNFGRYAQVESRTVALDRLLGIYEHVCRISHDTSPSTRTTIGETTDGPNNATTSFTTSSHVAMVRGLSGTGKSALVQQLVERIIDHQHHQDHQQQPMARPIVLSGKYNDQYNSLSSNGNVGGSTVASHKSTDSSSSSSRSHSGVGGVDSCPLGAIIEAFSGLAVALQNDEEALSRVQRAVRSSMGAQEIEILVSIIPALRIILVDDDDSGRGRDQDVTFDSDYNESNENALNQLNYIFATFCSAIATQEKPVILFLDDLQWSDSLSLRLLSSLLTDKTVNFFMFVGAFRSDEVHLSGLDSSLDILSKTMTVEYLDVHNLTMAELVTFIASVLNVDDEDKERTISLAEIIHSKTSGNLFFSKQILEQLHREGLLEFSRLTFQWEWHLEDVNLDDLLSDNVLHAVMSKISNTSPALQQALVTTAYTRSTIDLSILFELLSHLRHEQDVNDDNPVETPNSLEELAKILDYAVLDGLLSNSMGSSKYSFAHDRIQQAAYSLIPVGQERDSFRLQLGMLLLKLARGGNDSHCVESTTKSRGDDWMLFSAADHLNSVSYLYRMYHDEKELTQLNLEVGKLAASKIAYDTASKHLVLVLTDLRRQSRKNSPWYTNYALALETYRELAHVQLRQGNYDHGIHLGNQVLEHSRCLEDRLPTQIEMTKAFGRQEEHKDAVVVSNRALQELGVYPRNSVALHCTLLKNLLRVKSYFRNKTDDDFLSLPVMTDPKKLAAMELLESSGYHQYLLGNDIGFVIAILKMLVMTFKFGICGYAGVAVTGYALLSNNINDMKSAYRFGDLARLTLERTRRKDLECLQLFVTAHWIQGWRDPHPKVLEMFERAYRSGMETGDFENGMLSQTSGYHHAYTCGAPLRHLNERYGDLVDKLELYKIQFVLAFAVEQRRKIQHLIGDMNPPFDVKELGKFGPIKHDKTETYRLLYGYLSRLELGVYFGDYKFAEQMNKKLIPIDKAYTTTSLRLFFASITYASLARSSGKRSHRRKAYRFYRSLCKACEIKGMNSIHKCHILKAVLRTMTIRVDSDSNVVTSSFDRAIQSALNTGHIQDAALASQLVGEYLLSVSHSPAQDLQHQRDVMATSTKNDLIHQYLGRARELYERWGAVALVAHLDSKHSSILMKLPMSSGEYGAF